MMPDPNTPVTNPQPIHLVIVGAGLCGLAAAISTRLAGHRVTILEAVAELKEVGAGLQLTPNSTRLLQAWGLEEDLSRMAVTPQTFSMYRYNGRLLAHRDNYGPEIEYRYGAPLWCLHRADLQQTMAGRVEQLGVDLRLGARVETVDIESASVILQNGDIVRGDVVLAADGLWSKMRNILLPHPVYPKPTGDLAYRILLDASDIHNKELKAWLARPGIHIWVGPGVHAVAYSIKGGDLLNLVLLVPDDLPTNVAKAEGDLREMVELFEGWDPILLRFLQFANRVEKWRLNYRNTLLRSMPTNTEYDPVAPLPTWNNPAGSFIMAGDCAHPMLPYMAQGANSSLEDGATIGAILSHVHSTHQIPAAMALYDTIRRPRIDQLVTETFAQGKEHHLSDGKEQRERDELLARSMLNDTEVGVEGRWRHPKIQPWIYGHDVNETVEKAWKEKPF